MTYLAAPRRAVDKMQWDAFVDASDEAWLWHRYDFQDALATWGKRDLSFAVYDEAQRDTLLAVVPLHLTGSKVFRVVTWNTLDSLGGAALPNGMGEKHRAKVLAFIREHLLTLAWQYRAIEINLALCPMAPAYRGERCPRVNPLLHMGCENTLTQTWVVDLRRDKESLWAGLEKRARTAVRKAQKHGVQVRPAGPDDDLEVYYRLHCETYRRTGVRPHPLAYFAAIWRDFLACGYAHILLAEHAGTVVAAENFGIYKAGAVYWTGAALRQGLEVEANSLLQWTAMQWMIDRGITWYETGEAFPHVLEGKLKGLNDFKRSFGGSLYPLYRGCIVSRPRLKSLATGYGALRGVVGR